MSVQGWAIDPHRGAGGRRRYNNVRKIQAELRRVKVMEMLIVNGGGRGANAAISRALGVSEATISRDRAAINANGGKTCPTCGNYEPVGWDVWVEDHGASSRPSALPESVPIGAPKSPPMAQ